MMSSKWILLVLEDGVFREESVYYAIKLAQRMSCSISVLMLVETMGCNPEEHDSEKEILSKIIDIMEFEGTNTVSKFSAGDKASELLKHLANNPSFVTIVWGGREEIVSERRDRKIDHWFMKIKSNIQCPVVRPAKKKNKSTMKHESKGVLKKCK